VRLHLLAASLAVEPNRQLTSRKELKKKADRIESPITNQVSNS